MMVHGTQIMQAVILILEGDHPAEVKEQVCYIYLQILFLGYTIDTPQTIKQRKLPNNGLNVYHSVRPSVYQHFAC